MCRMFAVRANQATSSAGSLVESPICLQNQSCCDLRREKHSDGWGIGYYVGDQAHRVRSIHSAYQDREYQDLARNLASETMLAHVRQSSMGSVAINNCHPFNYRQWLFAHNGTIYGFPQVQDRVRNMIPDPLRREIQGDTDSEHAFFLLLARLQERHPLLDKTVDLPEVRNAVVSTIQELTKLCPGEKEKRSEFNFMLTDGRMLLASRWGHTLYWLKRQGHDPLDPDGPVGSPAPGYRAVVIASEPTTSEPWSELLDRSLICVQPDLSFEITSIG
jgi:predicted glutamine amidotransferase